MSDDRFQNKYRIESARADWHDYDGGSYFITICTKNREHFFGEIVNGEMVLSDIGKYAEEQFKNVSSHYPYAEIPLWTIMPNHLHAIVIIDGNKTKYDRRVVETWRAASLHANKNKTFLPNQCHLSEFFLHLQTKQHQTDTERQDITHKQHT